MSAHIPFSTILFPLSFSVLIQLYHYFCIIKFNLLLLCHQSGLSLCFFPKIECNEKDLHHYDLDKLFTTYSNGFYDFSVTTPVIHKGACVLSQVQMDSFSLSFVKIIPSSNVCNISFKSFL